ERDRSYCKYKVSALLRGDLNTPAEILEIERRNGIINADEWRERTERNPLPGGQGKLYFMPLNMAPIGDIMDRPAENLPAPQRSVRRPKYTEARSLAIRQRLGEAHLTALVAGRG